MLEICGVTQAAGQRRHLFRGLSFTAKCGEIVMLVGPNGSGKTTLLRISSGLREPEEGRVVLEQTDILRLPPHSRARSLAYLPQSTPLYYDLRVIDLVVLGRTPYLNAMGRPSRNDWDVVMEALEKVGVRELAERRVFSLSGGEYQRVMLARMLATRARCLIFDEPISALDIGHALQFLELCRGLSREGVCIVMAIHDIELARRYGDKVVLLYGNEGGDWRAGEPSEILIPAILEEVFHVRFSQTSHGLLPQ